MSLSPGLSLTDNLVLERELGGGGMGTVWLAHNRALGSQVAVKVLRVSEDDPAAARQRFEQEARAAAQIDHPHVVKVFDYGLTAAGEPYLVMELLRGEDLSQRIERAGPLSLAETVAVIGQACKALGRAHDQGIIHRDIKPANVFLLDVDGEQFVKVLDFGIAKYLGAPDAGLTQSGTVMGTPYFMSPEQIVAVEINARSDLWSLAVVAYCCLTGDVPFHGESVGALSLAIHGGGFAPVRQFRPELPAALDGWFARALSTLPDQRYGSARELADALAAACDPSALATPAAVAVSAAPQWQTGAATADTMAHAPTAAAPVAAWTGPAPEVGTVEVGTVAAPAATTATQPATAARTPGWLWLLAGVGVAALVVSAVILARGFFRDDDRMVDRDARSERKRDRSAQDTDEAVAAPASAAASSGRLVGKRGKRGKGAWPRSTKSSSGGAPPEASAQPGATRNLAAGRAAVATCWAGTEGAHGGSAPATSVSVSIAFAANDTVSSVTVGGAASSYAGFRRCAVSRLSSTRFGPGDQASVSWTQSLPASPPKK